MISQLYQVWESTLIILRGKKKKLTLSPPKFGSHPGLVHPESLIIHDKGWPIFQQMTCKHPFGFTFAFLSSFLFSFFFFFFFKQHILTFQPVYPYTVHRSYKLHFSAIFSLKMDPMTLFTHLKIILLQCFQFSVLTK